MPYANYFGDGADTIAYLEKFLRDKSSGVDLPAAIILETVQAEGGINLASDRWLRALRALTQELDILLIVDDIQVGCGRTGTFFSFEPSGIVPDVVLLSKSLSGFGLPMALTLISRPLDQWEPGEHTGTFRGNNLVFVTAAEALRFWEGDDLTKQVYQKESLLVDHLNQIAKQYPDTPFQVRGRGLIDGLVCPEGIADQLAAKAFERGLIIETSGANNEVVKFLPPLTIDLATLTKGLRCFSDCVAAVLSPTARHASP